MVTTRRRQIFHLIFLAKIRHDMPEDDSRVPNVIADFIGDNVNDIAGNCSDLLESFVATIAASIMIAVTLFINGIVNVSDETFIRMIIFPVILAGVGLIGCLIGLSYALYGRWEMIRQEN